MRSQLEKTTLSWKSRAQLLERYGDNQKGRETVDAIILSKIKAGQYANPDCPQDMTQLLFKTFWSADSSTSHGTAIAQQLSGAMPITPEACEVLTSTTGAFGMLPCLDRFPCR